MEGMAVQPTLVPKPRDRLDGLAIHIEHPDAIGHLLKLPSPPRTPASLQCAVASLSDRLGRDRHLLSDKMSRVSQGERGAAPAQPRREHIGVDDDPAGQSSFSAAWNASHSSSVNSEMARWSTDVITATPAMSSSNVRGLRNLASAWSISSLVGSVLHPCSLGQAYDRPRRWPAGSQPHEF